jgi:hypothetical protein
MSDKIMQGNIVDVMVEALISYTTQPAPRPTPVRAFLCRATWLFLPIRLDSVTRQGAAFLVRFLHVRVTP